MRNDPALLEPFRSSLGTLKFAQPTRACYVSAVRLFLHHHEGRDLDSLSVSDVRAYLEHLQACESSSSSRNVARAGLVQFLGYLVRRKASAPRLARAA